MGGCASKPKEESDILNVSLPTDDVVAPEKAEGKTVADQGTINNVDEIQNEAPLIDLSREEDENSSSEQKTSTVEAAPVSVEAHEETAKIAEDKVEDPTNELKDVKVEANNETKEPAKEAQVEPAKIDKSDVAPLSGDKSDAPLSTTA